MPPDERKKPTEIDGVSFVCIQCENHSYLIWIVRLFLAIRRMWPFNRHKNRQLLWIDRVQMRWIEAFSSRCAVHRPQFAEFLTCRQKNTSNMPLDWARACRKIIWGEAVAATVHAANMQAVHGTENYTASVKQPSGRRKNRAKTKVNAKCIIGCREVKKRKRFSLPPYNIINISRWSHNERAMNATKDS